MTSFSDLPIRFAMSLTRIFAAAIQSPRSSPIVLLDRCFFLFLVVALRFRLLLGFRGSFLLFAFLILIERGRLFLFHLLALAGELDDLLRGLLVDAVDRGEILGRGVENGVEVVVAGIFQLVRPLGGQAFDAIGRE